MIWFNGKQLPVHRNCAIKRAVRFKVIRALVFRRMSLQEGAYICDQLPLSGGPVYFCNAARAVGITVRTTAARYHGVKRAIQEYDIRHSDQVAHRIYRRRESGGNGRSRPVGTDL